MPNDSNYENYVVNSSQSIYATLLRNTSTTNYPMTYYTGYYAGGTPVVLDPHPMDVAKDLSTGNLWQFTGVAWVAPSWQTSITIWLGAAEDVCQRLQSEDTRIPDTVHVYIGTDGEVPPELALTADDLAIKHDVGNYNLNVNVLRKDVTTDTFVDVPFPEGYVVTTEDGNWTVLKNFNKCVGYDYATVSLAWTTTADGQGPQSVDYVTSGEAREIAEDVVSSGGAIDISGGNGINVTTSGGSSVVEFSGSAQFVDSDTDDVTTLHVTPAGLFVAYTQGPISRTFSVTDNVYIDGVVVATEPWVEDYVSSHGGGGVQSGAIIEGQPFSTTVGLYTMTYTGSGGLVVSGSGASVVLSGGGIVTNIDSTGEDGRYAQFSATSRGVVMLAGYDAGAGTVEITTEGAVNIYAGGVDKDVNIDATGEVLVKNNPVATKNDLQSALLSGAEIDTIIGDYRITATSGGVVVSGSGAEVVLSGGQIVASADNGDEDTPGHFALTMSSGGLIADVFRNIGGPESGHIELTPDEIAVSGGGASVVLSGGVYIDVIDENEEHQSLYINGGGVSIDGAGPVAGVNIRGGASGINCDTDTPDGFTVNGRAVATQLVTSTTDTDVDIISVLSGGTSYVYTTPLVSLDVQSVVKTPEASYIHFTLDSVTAPTPVAISGVSCLNSVTFEGGKEYLVGFFDGMAVVNEVTAVSGVVLS